MLKLEVLEVGDAFAEVDILEVLTLGRGGGTKLRGGGIGELITQNNMPVYVEIKNKIVPEFNLTSELNNAKKNPTQLFELNKQFEVKKLKVGLEKK